MMRTFYIKLRLIVIVFLNELLKELRIMYLSEKEFVGRHVDIEINRKRWALETNVIVVGEKRLGTGVRKVHHQIVFYVSDNVITRWLGYRKNRVHYDLTSWYQGGAMKAQIGGINLEGETVK